MKTIAMAVSVAAIALACGLQVVASDEPVTLKGEIKCGKCVAKEAEAKACENILQTTDANGKKVSYVLVENTTTKEYKGKACHEAQKVRVTGTVQEVNGKKRLTATKIEKETVS